MVYWTIAMGAFTGLAVFGALYAKRVFRRPIRPTWWEVVIGDGVTGIGISIVQFALVHSATSDAFLSSIVVASLWLGFAITGLPMIALQCRKQHFQKEQARKASVKTKSMADDG